ncbi:Very-long-chain (3R)-3-hydroxyacyl-[acyl-carrier protein] dehydratase 3 [Toxocara canis]|uniref:Very-long-chain (3R)-3-hydroxyacyl-CoA dehydratase n=1 Tax=Toxocara canis TaxID=6265 RepID=A0A0B2V0L1_TOXCA|nr:Very-long-chain (3R)-3-hydroxyacyl-[acyl-carrier protein] dehydratase 3 [Toxocara canis]
MASSPFVYWAQDEHSVFLTVDLKDATNIRYMLSGNVFEFRSIGTGAQGRKEYSFELTLFDDVSVEKESNEYGRRLVYSLKKMNKGWWPTITKQPSRISWLRVDFDRFKDPDESDDDFEMVNSPQRMAEKEMDLLTQQLLKEATKRPTSFSDRLSAKESTSYFNAIAVKKMRDECSALLGQYLFVCNVTLFLIHFYILAVLLSRFIANGNEYMQRFWDEKSLAIRVATALQLLDVVHAILGIIKSGYQTALLQRFWDEKSLAIRVATALQLLDVVHAILGIIKSGYQTALLQVVGRLTMLFIIDGDPELHITLSTYLLMLVYFLIEMFRYPYYALASLKLHYWIVTWLRYTAWVPLYPMGLLLEVITIYRAIPYYYTSGKYSIEMPNAANFAFNFGAFLLVFVLFAFPLIAYRLLSHMRLQARKKLEELKKKPQ